MVEVPYFNIFCCFLCVTEQDAASGPLPDIIPQRFPPSASAPAPLNLLNPLNSSINTIGQPYGSEICSYGPIYHSHNLLAAHSHGYGGHAYPTDKNLRGNHFPRGIYGNYQGFYPAPTVNNRPQPPTNFNDFNQR